MSANLHELTKQLDVLTWNSRSVLNALIRSVMAASSSKGFTVKRAGKSVELTQNEIYLIADFYEAWEASGYVTGDNFYDLLNKIEEKHANTNNGYTVAGALVDHAKLMWMNSDNADSEAQYWLDKIQAVENPKWFTNTAPIPVSIRTPIYDENLSTKTFDEYDSYLFPSGYYSMDTLGYKGDGNAHTGGGESWLFDIDNVFTVHADRILLGDQDPESYNINSNSYNASSAQSVSPLYSLEGGHNSFAYGNYSVAYGVNNHAFAKASVALGGADNFVYSYSSAILGGTSNNVADTYSVCAGGMYNNLAGSGSFCANNRNHTGGYNYYFNRSITGSWSDTNTDCEKELTIGQCTYKRVDTDATVATDEYAIGPNQLFIPYDEVLLSGIPQGNQISGGWEGGARSPLDFKVGDTVRLHSFIIVTDTGRWQKATSTLSGTVIQIEAIKNKQNNATLGYRITLNNTFTENNINGLGSYSVYSGRVCRLSAVDYPNTQVRFSDYSVLFKKSDIAALDSDGVSVFGYNNIATGYYQTVVGMSNKELIRPQFIVGGGSSYVAQNKDTSDFHRHNSLVVSSNYSYASVTTNSYIISGISAYTTSYLHGDPTWATNRTYDEDYVLDGIEKYEGVYAYSLDPKKLDETKALLRVFHGHTTLAIGWTGLHIYEPYTEDNGQTKTVWAELCSDHGGIALHTGTALESGAQDESNNWLDFYNNWTRSSTYPGHDNSITIWAKDFAGIHGSSVYVHANRPSGYVVLDGGNIKIRGNTIKALAVQPTDDGVEPHNLLARRIDTITDSGFDYASKTNNTVWANFGDVFTKAQNNMYFFSYHVMSSSKKLSTYSNGGSTYDVYDLAQLVLPGNLSDACNVGLRQTENIPHPEVIVSKVYYNKSNPSSTYSGRDTGSGCLHEELAYMSDLDNYVRKDSVESSSICQMYSLVGVLAYDLFDRGPVEYYKTDQGTVDIPGNNKFFVYDTYLYSMINADVSDMGRKWFEPNPVEITTSTAYDGKLVRPTKTPGWLAKNLIHLDKLGGSYYLDGVAINPSMYMNVSDGNNKVVGINYLAFGKPDDNAYSYYIMMYNQPESAVTTGTTLWTSKYSNGTPVNMTRTPTQSVWTTVLFDHSSSSSPLRWVKLLDNFHMYYANNTLCVEFALIGSTLTKTNAYNSELHDTYAMPVIADPNSGAMKVNLTADEDDWTRMCSTSIGADDQKSIRLCIPVDPALGEHLRNVTNASTGVNANMYGRVEYTGNTNVFVTATYYYNVGVFTANNTIYPNFGYRGGYLVINIAGWNHTLLSTHQVHLEGLVNYV